MDAIVRNVFESNPSRSHKELNRRLMKLGEEYGEVLEAYLAVSGVNNYKNKSWDDVREEISDVVIVALDIMLTRMPSEDNLTDEELIARIEGEITRKLDKWKKVRGEHTTS